MAVSPAMLFLLVAFAPCHDHATAGGLFEKGALAASDLLISEFYPRGFCADEYVVVVNSGPYLLNLRNWSLCDGEGSLRFVQDLWVPPGDAVSISFNGSSFCSAYGQKPSIALDNASSRAAIEPIGTFRLGDQGDSISLVAPSGDVRDCIRYGNCSDEIVAWSGDPVPTLRHGEVARRAALGTVYIDTGRAGDWMSFREYRYGYTDFEGFSVEVMAGNILAFTSPDSSFEVLRDCIRVSESHIMLCFYEMSSRGLCSSLLEAMARGVTVRVLVDGAPVGGFSDDERICLSALASHGADVRVLAGNSSRDAVQHVGHLHAKYVVFDGVRAAVLSENFVDSGIPEDTLRGNRGWGLLISDERLAAHLEALFDSDSRGSRPDTRTWQDDPSFDAGATVDYVRSANATTRVLEPHVTSAPARIGVHISPDCSESAPFIEPLLASSKSLIGEQFQADLQWISRWSNINATNPLVAAIASSMKNGSYVRMLFDSSWFNVESNSPVCDFLQESAHEAGSGSEFRLMQNGGPIRVLHNKGLVIDGSKTLVSSNNWVYSSFARNRELALVVDSAELASYFTDAFLVDWISDSQPPEADAGSDIEVYLGQEFCLDGTRSKDDRAIASWEWDLYADGEVDGTGSQVRFFATIPGRHTVILRVEDPWGNQDTDEATVTVLPTQEPDTRYGLSGILGSPWPYVGAGVLGCVCGVFLARIRRGRRRARLIIGDRIDSLR